MLKVVVWPNGADFAPEILRELPEEEVARSKKKSPDSTLRRFAARR